ncbi:MAG: aminopeptidase P family protein [Tissierellia bacterium]|nr:aminopeptidase P family protein [Tissierellia bacterium]
MNIYEKIDLLREKMREYKIDAYVVPTSDPHQSEYLPDYYKTREFISGFTGSAGTAVITLDKAGLWTDGRYFTQAARELGQGPFKLYKMGLDIDYIEFINQEVTEFGRVGLDGKCLSLSDYDKMSAQFGDKIIRTDLDFISEIWQEDRPALPQDKIYILDEKYTGQSYEEKLKIVRAMMKQRGADYFFIGALEDIAYLFNLRGNDITATPIFISFALITQDEVSLFIDPKKLDDEVMDYLQERNVGVFAYDAIYEKMNEIPGKSIIYLDPSKTNVLIYQKLNSNVRVKRGINLTTLMKALKNDVEIANSKKAFLKDARALVRFFNWVETGVATGNIDEVMAANKLLDFRKQEDLFIEPSFATISAYGPNAAMPHYDPNKVTPATLTNKGLYLVDSGGQYLDGTTDITRTLALGQVSPEERMHYTLTLKSHIAAMTAKFQKNTTGLSLDAICRYPMNKEGLDFNHGTGHGVGFVLGVHEGPMSLSKRDTGISLEEGMVFSIEPGIYIEGKHGIRIENIVYVKKSEFEGYYELESLSYVPLDTRPVDKDMLDSWEVDWLNDYNKQCRLKLQEMLEGSDLDYLIRATAEI